MERRRVAVGDVAQSQGRIRSRGVSHKDLKFQIVVDFSTIGRCQYKTDFIAHEQLSSEYLGKNRIAPWRCLNVTAILSSFAEHNRIKPERING